MHLATGGSKQKAKLAPFSTYNRVSNKIEGRRNNFGVDQMSRWSVLGSSLFAGINHSILCSPLPYGGSKYSIPFAMEETPKVPLMKWVIKCERQNAEGRVHAAAAWIGRPKLQF